MFFELRFLDLKKLIARKLFLLSQGSPPPPIIKGRTRLYRIEAQRATSERQMDKMYCHWLKKTNMVPYARVARSNLEGQYSKKVSDVQRLSNNVNLIAISKIRKCSVRCSVLPASKQRCYLMVIVTMATHIFSLPAGLNSERSLSENLKSLSILLHNRWTSESFLEYFLDSIGTNFSL